jgi:Icc-related predicted phosphoesterase
MQVLTISDEIVRTIYTPAGQARFRDVKLVLGCGDLPASYLEYVVSVLNVPLLYVPGNHDGRPEVTESGEELMEPAGCIKIDGRLMQAAGLWVFGLGGSRWYNGDPHQYTELGMLMRVLLLMPRLLLRERRIGRPLDIMIAHAPARDLLDGPGAHRGFRSLRWLLERVQPRYFIHGHVHPSYGYNKRQTETVFGQTRIINTVGYRLLDIAAPVAAPRERAIG